MPSRRTFLKGIGAVGITAAIAGCGGPQGAGGFGSGGAAGGVANGFAYEDPAVAPEDATHTVTTPDAFATAVNAGTPDDPAIVRIPPDAAIDLSNRSFVLDNVVIASSRQAESESGDGDGHGNGHPGGMLYTTSIGAQSTAHSGGPGTGLLTLTDKARLTGIRLRGPTSAVYDHPMFSGYIPQPSGSRSERMAFYDRYRARGITVSSDTVQIDNCEIFGWSDQGISVGQKGHPVNPQINNSSIHDCMMTSAGYGVDVQCGHPVVSQCYFNATRHAVAGFGYPDAGYTLQNCVFGPANALFQVDMHYLGENIGGSADPSAYNYRYRSGGLMRILGCTFTSTHVIRAANFAGGKPTPAIVIGGIPKEGVVIHGNTFSHPPPGNNPSVFNQSTTPGSHSLGPNGFAPPEKFDIQDNQYNASFEFAIGHG